MTTSTVGPDYQEHFNTEKFLQICIANYDIFTQHMLQCYYSTFRTLQNDLSVLDFGSGPTISACIPASTKASSIVLSDYTDSNCTALRQWLAKKENAYNWTPYIKQVLSKFESEVDNEQVQKKIENIRKLVKAVVHCDLTQDPPIDSGYNQQYDVVMTSMVICVTSRCVEDYRQGVIKLGKLVKPGGTLMIYDAEVKSDNHKGTYDVGTKIFQYVGITKEFGVQAMKDAGFTDIYTTSYAGGSYYKNSEDPMRLGFIFIQGKKSMHYN